MTMAYQETLEKTGDLIGNKIADALAKSYDVRTTKFPKTLQ